MGEECKDSKVIDESTNLTFYYFAHEMYGWVGPNLPPLANVDNV